MLKTNYIALIIKQIVHLVSFFKTSVLSYPRAAPGGEHFGFVEGVF